jgi:hypothetical protein
MLKMVTFNGVVSTLSTYADKSIDNSGTTTYASYDLINVALNLNF